MQSPKLEIELMEIKDGVKIYLVKILDIISIVTNLKQKYNRGFFLFRSFKKKTRGEEELDTFLNIIPFSSNYMILRSSALFSSEKNLFCLNTNHAQTQLRISSHIKVKNLTDECMIGLSEYQFLIYRYLCNLSQIFYMSAFLRKGGELRRSLEQSLKQLSEQTSKQSSEQTSKQSSEQTSKQSNEDSLDLNIAINLATYQSDDY
jgi:hypothetical protein